MVCLTYLPNVVLCCLIDYATIFISVIYDDPKASRRRWLQHHLSCLLGSPLLRLWYRQTMGECSLALPWMESRLQSLQLHSAGSWAAWAARPHARTLQLTPFPWFTVNTGSIIGVLVHQQYLNLWLNDIMRKYRLCRHVKYVCSCHLVYFCHYARYLELWWVYSLLS